MQDQFSSVENMLRWQIDIACKRLAELNDALSKCGELYPLPNQTDGLPDNWAFKKYSQHQIALVHALDGLKWVSHEIEKAESALSVSDLPTAIFWIIKANQSISLTNAHWVSSAAVRTYRYVGEYRKGQSLKARKPRGKINNDGETIHNIIELLAVSKAYEDMLAKELWPHFYSKLEDRKLNPEEIAHPQDLKKYAYKYDSGSHRKSITFGRFENIVSACRTKKSR